MNTRLDQFDDSVEARLARLQPSVAVNGLREATLMQVQRELHASRWDRRLSRVAVVLLVVGIGMNVATVNERPTLPTGGLFAARPTMKSTTDSIAELAITMADATDIKTANIFARHLAVLGGFPLGSDQNDAIKREIDRLLSPAVPHGKDG